MEGQEIMNGELARKRPPATLMRVAGSNLPRHEVIRRPTRAAALAVVERMAVDGEIGAAFALAETEHGYAVKVVRIREPRRGGFRWPLLIALLTSASLALLAVWLLVKAITPILPVLIGGAVALALLAIAGRRRGRSVSVTQTVVVHHR